MLNVRMIKYGVLGVTVLCLIALLPQLSTSRRTNARSVPTRDNSQTSTDPQFNILTANDVPSLKDGTVSCISLKSAGGKSICVDTEDKWIGPSIRRTGVWEGAVWHQMQNLFEQDPELNLIDIGANIGVFTLSAAALGRQVVAVEAFYENIQRMSESLRMGNVSDKVIIVHNAVSNVYEDVNFWRPKDNPGGTHTVSKGVTLAPNKPIFQGDHNTVRTIFINDLIRIVPFKKAILKIDIEGYEGKAFKKAEYLLDNMDIKALFMEWTFVTRSDDCMNIVRIMTSRGYRAHGLKLKALNGMTRQEVGKWPGEIVWLKSDSESTESEKLTHRPQEHVNQYTDGMKPEKPVKINILDPGSVPPMKDNTKCLKLSTADNNFICIDTKDSAIGRSIEKTGAWEKHIWPRMKSFFDRDPDFGLIDIGANIGVYTISVAAMGREVVAVEAFYENIQRLCAALRLNIQTEKVTLVHNAVSDVYENVSFWRPRNNPGGTHTFTKGLTLAPNKPTFKGEHDSVATIHLDDLVPVTKFKKAVMKIDIEGYENKAFKKIENLLDTVDIVALFMEWTFIKRDPSVVDIVEMMRSRNYEATGVNSKSLKGSKLEDIRSWPPDIVWVKH